MEIVGGGFLATHLRSIDHLHSDTVVFAAGVSGSYGAAQADFDRDAELVYRSIVDCQRTGRRLAYFSTSSVGMYGVRVSVGREDGPVFPTSSYGRHKLAMEAVIAHAGIDYLILRLAYPVGPGQRAHQFLPSLVGQVRAGSVRIHRGARRDVIDVADVVELVGALLSSGASREIVNVASGHAIPVERIVARLEERLDAAVRRQYVDVPVEPSVSVAKLRRLAPCAERMGFSDTYHESVIDRYLAATAVAPY